MTSRFQRSVCGMAVAALLAGGGADPAADAMGLPGLASAAFADDDDGGRGGRGGGGGGGRGGGGRDEDGDDDRPVRQVRPGQLFIFPFMATPQRERPRPARRARVAPRADGLVVARLTEADIAGLAREGYRIRARRLSTLHGGWTVRVTVPRRLRTEAAIADLERRLPSALIDRNHLYPAFRSQSGGSASGERTRQDRSQHARRLMGWPDGACATDAVIGMVDTGVDVAQPALSGAAIETITMRSPDRRPSGTEHGTAVAVLLAGEAGPFRAVARTARVIAADAFHRREGVDMADAFDLAAALEELGERGATVVSLSLAGAANDLVDETGRRLAERGVVIVAAAGNDGAGSPPRFPAAYPWAVAATAIDGTGRLYARAVRGPHIAFAAPGVRLPIPWGPKSTARYLTGTSFSAPLVAAALAYMRPEDTDAPRRERTTRLALLTEDLGAPGRDAQFGWGAVKLGGRCP